MVRREGRHGDLDLVQLHPVEGIEKTKRSEVYGLRIDRSADDVRSGHQTPSLQQHC